ncbi:MAG: GNAT family protein [Anaerolineae bacterium]
MLHYPLGDNADLRLLLPYHAEELAALVVRNEAYLGQWLDLARRFDQTKALALINEFLRRLADDGGIMLGIFHQGELAGMISNRWERAWKNSELTYLLGAEYQGKGLMTRAVKALTDYSFGDLALRRIEIIVQVGNEASAGVAKRAGYHFEGIRELSVGREDGAFDAEIYVALAPRWNRNGNN